MNLSIHFRNGTVKALTRRLEEAYRRGKARLVRRIQVNTMSVQVRECQCPACLQSQDHAAWQRHPQMNVFLSRLDEQPRRWYVALESKRVRHGGDTLLSQITGRDVETIRRGRRELDDEFAPRPVARTRDTGGGRPPVEKKTR